MAMLVLFMALLMVVLAFRLKLMMLKLKVVGVGEDVGVDFLCLRGCYCCYISVLGIMLVFRWKLRLVVFVCCFSCVDVVFVLCFV